MLERAVEEERAPAIARLHRGRRLRRRLRLRLPLDHAGVRRDHRHRHRPGPAPDPDMNWYHRGEARYVEYGSSFAARRTFGIHRSLTDTIYNMNLAHLSPDVQTVFESLDDADVRTAGTTFLIYRGRHRHEIARETALSRLADPDPVPARGLGPARAVLRRPLRHPPHRLPRPARPARRARPAHRLRGLLPGRARPLRLPALLAARQRHPLAQDRPARARSTRSPAPTASSQRLCDAAGGIDAFLEEHAVIVMARPLPGADRGAHLARRGLRGLEGARGRCGARGRAPRSPSARPSARPMLYVIDEERRDELLPELVGTALETPGVDLVLSRDGGEAVITSAQGELRFAPGGALVDLRGGAWSRRGDLGVLELRAPTDGVCERTSTRTRWRASWAALTLPDRRRPAALGRARLRVHRLGRRRPCRRGQPRLAAPLRLAGRAAVVWHRPRPARGARHSGRCAMLRRWCANTSASNARDPLRLLSWPDA